MIVAIDGRKVTSHDVVVVILASLTPGSPVTVDWISEDGRHHQGATHPHGRTAALTIAELLIG